MLIFIIFAMTIGMDMYDEVGGKWVSFRFDYSTSVIDSMIERGTDITPQPFKIACKIMRNKYGNKDICKETGTTYLDQFWVSDTDRPLDFTITIHDRIMRGDFFSGIMGTELITEHNAVITGGK